MSSSESSPDYTGVTETPGTLVSHEAASMALSRHEMVRRLAAGRRVLEVACGSGQGRVFEECRRVLRREGILVLSSINPAWTDFNPSPHAAGYLGAGDLKTALEGAFRSVDILFGFAVPRRGPVGLALSAIKRLAVRLKLIPGTMRGKTLLKRMFLGALVPVPAELTPGLAPVDEPRPAPLHDSSRFRIIYAVAHL